MSLNIVIRSSRWLSYFSLLINVDCKSKEGVRAPKGIFLLVVAERFVSATQVLLIRKLLYLFTNVVNRSDFKAFQKVFIIVRPLQMFVVFEIGASNLWGERRQNYIVALEVFNLIVKIRNHQGILFVILRELSPDVWKISLHRYWSEVTWINLSLWIKTYEKKSEVIVENLKQVLTEKSIFQTKFWSEVQSFIGHCLTISRYHTCAYLLWAFHK